MTVLSWLKRTFGDRSGRPGPRYGEAYAADLTVSRLEERRVLTAPTLDPIADPAAINEDDGEQTINLTGITDADGDTQALQVTATSDTPGLIPDPTVVYTPNNNFGSLKYTPVADQSGTAVITVTVTDGGTDGVIGTGGDDETFQRQFNVAVNPVNDDAPVSQNIAGNVSEDGPALVINANSDDVDVDDTPLTLTYSIVSGPTLGAGPVGALTTASLVNNNDGTFTFDPGSDFHSLAVGQSQDVTFTYKATDSHAQDSNVATATITVNGANDAPTSQDVSTNVSEDGPAVVVNANSDDVDTDDTPASLTYGIVSGPTLGAGPVGALTTASLVNNNDGTFTFNPGTDFQSLAVGQSQDVTFTYKATDSHAQDSNTATVTITVNGANDPPTAVADPAATDEDTAKAIDVLANDSDPDTADTLTVSLPLATSAQGAAVTLGPGNQVTYDPTGAANLQQLAKGANLVDTFDYKISDGNGGFSTATVSVTVTGVNDPPTANDIAGAADEDGVAILLNASADDIDTDDTPLTLTYSLVTNTGAGNGTVTNNNDGTFSFDPGTDFQGLAVGETKNVTFTYKATDMHGADSNTATATITVTGKNDAPVSQDISGNVSEAGPALVINANSDDVDSDDTPATLSYSIVGGPTFGAGPATKFTTGSLVNNKDGTFTFDPGTDFQALGSGESQQVTFTYQTKDSHNDTSNVATATITVNGLNEAPTAVNDNAATDEDTAKAIDVLANDTDPDVNDTLTVSLPAATSAQGAAVSLGPGNQVTYDPTGAANLQKLAAGANLVDTFDYKISDGNGGFSTATVSVTVTGVNDPPTANDIAGAADEDGVAILLNASADDLDTDDTPVTLTYSVVTAPGAGNGSVINNNDGTFTFNPGADFQDLALGETRDVTFTYKATDMHGADSNTATATITITGKNDAPTSKNIAGNVSEDGPALVINANADDVDSDDTPASLKYSIVTGATLGAGPVGALTTATLVNNNDGTFTFNPGNDFHTLAVGQSQQVTFTYQAKDTHNAVSNISTATITIDGANDIPVVQPVAIAAVEDGPTVNGKFVGDDIDTDDSAASLKYSIVAPPAEGSVVNNNDGTFTFNPGADFQDLAVGETRDVTFTYRATDQHTADSLDGKVTVTVTGVNDNPTAQDVAAAGTEDDAGILIAGNANDVDSDDTPLTLNYQIVTAPAQGNLINNGNGTFTFQPNGQFDGLAVGESATVKFRYRVQDKHGALSNTKEGEITINGVNDAPVIANFNLSANSVNEKAPFSISGNLTDLDINDNHVVTVSWGDGTTSTSADGSVQYDPATRRFAANHVYEDDNPTNTPFDPANIRVTVTDGQGVVVFQDRGITVRDVPPSIVQVSATDVTALGETTVSGVVQDPSFADGQTVVIIWGDDTPPDVIPVVMNNGVGTFSASHMYFGNPNRTNPAAGIPIQVIVTDDDSLSHIVELEAGVPGSGLATPILNVTPTVPPLTFATIAPTETPTEVQSAPEAVQFISYESGPSGPTETGQVRVELRVVSPEGKEGEGITLNDENTRAEEVLKDLPRIFKSLPDDHYRIYLVREDGTERLVLNVILRRNKQIDQNESGSESSGAKKDAPKIPRARKPKEKESTEKTNERDGKPVSGRPLELRFNTRTTDEEPLQLNSGPRILPPQPDGLSPITVPTATETEDTPPGDDSTALEPDGEIGNTDHYVETGVGLAAWLGVAGRLRWQRKVDEAMSQYGRAGLAERRRRLARIRQSQSTKPLN